MFRRTVVTIAGLSALTVPAACAPMTLADPDIVDVTARAGTFTPSIRS